MNWPTTCEHRYWYSRKDGEHILVFKCRCGKEEQYDQESDEWYP